MLWLFRCGCTRCRGCPHPCDDESIRRRSTLYCWRRIFLAQELVAVLARSYPNHASRLPIREVPDDLVRDMAKFDPNARTIVHELGRDLSVSSAKARTHPELELTTGRGVYRGQCTKPHRPGIGTRRAIDQTSLTHPF